MRWAFRRKSQTASSIGPSLASSAPQHFAMVLDEWELLTWLTFRRGEGLEVTSEGLPEPSAGERGGSGSEGSAAGSFVTSSGSSFEERLPSENWQVGAGLV